MSQSDVYICTKIAIPSLASDLQSSSFSSSTFPSLPPPSYSPGFLPLLVSILSR